ncbi:MAG: 1-deoxy-D-xylulose-5-phosphate synthase [Gammaproteobacteria bacterium]|nr:1-deoxy-D-xylulose-5-phosphate synthase [Gammaproteobacteria bacterium]
MGAESNTNNPDYSAYPLLEKINSPDDLRRYDPQKLKTLSRELRQFLLESLNRTGGHLSSGLGVIELTIALHYVFNTPYDKLIWDVGHQAYPHKILTGRLKQMHTIRQKGGLSGFPSRKESNYDTFGVGHSSTSISAALGMSVADKIRHGDAATKNHIAIIGDGAMTAGMAFEALNHAGDMHANLLVILNDNNMSISPNVGGLSNHFANIISSKLYVSMRENSKKLLSHVPPMWELAKRTEEHMKGMIVPGTLFEELGFNYFGPIDGNNLEELLHTLENIKSIKGPRFLHIVTKKGYGYEKAVQDPINFHAVSKGYYLDKKENTAATQAIKTYTEVFSKWICDKAQQDERLVGITPAMREGSGLVEFAEQYPKRYYDVAIAEQHAVTFAAGLACDGYKPVVAIYSSFLQRAYDQLIHDVAIQNLPVVFAIDRAGLVGTDGATHTGNFDLSFMRCIPNMVICTPANENEAYHLLDFAFSIDKPVAVRYPRGNGCGEEITNALKVELGKANVLSKKTTGKSSKDSIQVAILNFGIFLSHILKIEDHLIALGIDLTIVDMRFVKPMDQQLVKQVAQENQILITIEDNVIAGGAGSAVSEVISEIEHSPPVYHFGLPDQFPEHATQEELYHQYQLDADGLLQRIKHLLKL